MHKNIPIVDFSHFAKESGKHAVAEDWDKIQTLIFRALSEIGFVYIINHGIDPEKIQRCFAESKTFFEQSTNAKLKYSRQSATGCDHSYSQQNQEKLHSSSAYEFKESYDFYAQNDLPQINQSIVEISNFHKSLSELRNDCTPFVKTLLKLFARALEVDEGYFVNITKGICDGRTHSYTMLRSLYYPQIPDDVKIQPGYVRCAEHTDYGILTVLFQDEIGGLEVKSVNESWIPAGPIPGSVLINTGDLLELWTGGRFPATAHRVLIPEAELRKRIPRQSIAYFINPDNTTLVAPLFSSKNSKSNVNPVSAYEHMSNKLIASYD